MLLVLSRHLTRCTSQAPFSTHALNVFDRRTKWRQRQSSCNQPDYKTYEYIREEIGWRVADRVFDVKRTFPLALELAAGRGYVSRHLDKESVNCVLAVDPVREMLLQRVSGDDLASWQCSDVQMDDEKLSMRPHMVDLVLSSLSMHWVNDLPGAFTRIFHSLVPDGAFIGAMFYGDTLFELRTSLQLAELERRGGFSPRVSPFVRAEDVAGLLNSIGYKLITIDTDDLVVNYPSMFELLEDLRGMGEQNCTWQRSAGLSKALLSAAAANYTASYGDADGNVPATFQILYWIAWSPHESQQKPITRGSAKHSLKNIGDNDSAVKS